MNTSNHKLQMRFRHDARTTFVLLGVGILAFSITQFAYGPRVFARTQLLSHGTATLGARFAQVGLRPSIPKNAIRLGRARSIKAISIETVMRPRDQKRLSRLLQLVTTPGSPDYRHFLSKDAFAREFGASDQTISAVKAQLQQLGLRPGRIAANRLAIAASGSIETVEHAFHTTVYQYQLPDKSEFLANSSAPVVPSSLAANVSEILGLSTIPSIAPNGLVISPLDIAPQAQAEPKTDGPVPTNACASAMAGSGAYTANQIAGAYGLSDLYDDGDFGTGETVAFVEFSSFSTPDVSFFANCYTAAPKSTITPVLVDGGPSTGINPTFNVEAELDIEDFISLAPTANVLVYEGAGNAQGVSNSAAYDVYTKAVQDDTTQIISTSFGACEAGYSTASLQNEATVFEQAALQGQTMLSASGDSGSEDCDGESQAPAGASSLLNVDDPASQPYVTGVGGTTLTLGQTNNETVWNDRSGAGGGGRSTDWAMPTYQEDAAAGLGVAAAGGDSGGCGTGSTLCREVPDVSADAGSPYAIYCTATICANQGWTPIGGTSAAAPTWAAVVALINASAGCSTADQHVGFLNPALYSIASSSKYSSDFNDITAGNNDFTGQNGGLYPARAGYDLASGLGSPIVATSSGGGLVSQLCKPAPSSSASVTLGTPPKIKTLKPRRARSSGGTKVLIIGSKFSGATRVLFGSKLARRFHVDSATRITAIAPSGAGNVPVVVVTLSGRSKHESVAVFHYLTVPLISRITPSRGSDSGGTQVVIFGKFLNKTKTVYFGKNPAARFVVRSTSQLVATAPRGSGSVGITVKSAGGQSTVTRFDQFFYGPV